VEAGRNPLAMTTQVITVELAHPGQLFTTDDVSPTSSLYTEYTAQPAMVTIRDMLLRHQPRKTGDVDLVLVLPAEQIRSGLADELTTAVRRWVRAQNIIDIDSTGAGGAIGRRLLPLGVLAFFLFQFASVLVRNAAEPGDAYLIDVLGEGLSVTSWVLLWFPVQLITMEVWRSAIMRRRMRILDRITVRLEPAED
jgi:hypothetical protein